MRKLLGIFLLATASVYAAYQPTVTLNGDQLDGFGRVQVADPVTLFTSAFQYSREPLVWQCITNNGGNVVHLPNESSVSIVVTGATETAAMQTYSYFRYLPGKAQQIFQTGVFDSSTNSIKRLGYYDADNGLFWQMSNNVAAVVRRTKASGTVVDNIHPSSTWNIDRLDGTGPSGVNFFLGTSSNRFYNGGIFIIDLEWLGYGRVRWGANIDGKTVWLHEATNANNLATVYMTTANLPLRAEVIPLAGIGETNKLTFTCNSVISSGGVDDEAGYETSFGSTIDTSLSTTPAHIISIRPAATFNSITNRAQIIATKVDVSSSGTGGAYWEVLYGSTFSAGDWASWDSTSAVEVSTNATIDVAGKVIAHGFIGGAGAANQRVSDSKNLASKLPLTLDYQGLNPKALTLRVRTLTSTGNGRGGFSTKESR
jgi:hypothetical protein